MGILDGKRIVVTGASRGLGRAFAVAVAAEGAQVVVNGTNEGLVAGVVDSITSAGGVAVPAVGSVADDALAESVVTTCVDAFGGIDAVVNNAGIVRDRTLMNMTPEEFDEVIAVNLRGTWSMSRHAARAMRETWRPPPAGRVERGVRRVGRADELRRIQGGSDGDAVLVGCRAEAVRHPRATRSGRSRRPT